MAAQTQEVQAEVQEGKMPKVARNKKGLTKKQQRFVDVYDGDTQRAAVMAGISYAYARQLVCNLQTSANRKSALAVQKAIKEREIKENRVKIASRQQRQQFWTELMTDDEREDSTRLKASELLAKSELDFGDTGVNVNIASVADIFAKVQGSQFSALNTVKALDTGTNEDIVKDTPPLLSEKQG